MHVITIIAILLGAALVGRWAWDTSGTRDGDSRPAGLVQSLIWLLALGYLGAASVWLAQGGQTIFPIVCASCLAGMLLVRSLATPRARSSSDPTPEVTPDVEAGTTPATPEASADADPVFRLERIRTYSGTFRVNTQPLPEVSERETTILVVEDSELTSQVLAAYIRKSGYRVLVANDGASAIRLLDGDENIDLAVLDYWLPDMEGLELLVRIKSDARRAEIPVLVLSSENEAEFMAPCIAAGADDFLPKPFVPSILDARIESSLARRQFQERERLYMERIQRERERADELLRVILPAPIVQELSRTDRVSPKRHEHVAVLFADISGFSAYCDKRQPEEVLSHLQSIVVAFEELAAAHGVQKIKTIGDSFMAACGLLQEVENPVLQCVKMALHMVGIVEEVVPQWSLRVGIHIGPVVAGIVGRSQYLFDIWGDTVNTASRVESNGRDGQVCVSSQAWEEVRAFVRGESLGQVQAKGKGEIELFRVDGLRSDTGSDGIPTPVNSSLIALCS